MTSTAIDRLGAPASDAVVRDLARLLVQAVEEGAAVSFVAPLAIEAAAAWWRDVLGRTPAPMVLVARAGTGDRRIVGTVQLVPAWAPNQPHRAELVKLLVDREHRGSGLGARLVRAAEAMGRDAGFTLLTLDAKRGEAAERLYRRLGWVHAGTFPGFAVDPDGTTLHDAVLFYRRLAPEPALAASDPPIAVVRLRPDDWQAYRALMLEGYEAHPDAFTSSVEERAAVAPSFWQSRLGSDASKAFGVWADGPAGTALAGTALAGAVAVAWSPRPKERHKATLVGLYVRPAHRGRGVAGALVEAVLAAARARDGVRVVTLTVSEPNHGARRLYRHCGFTEFGLEPEAMAHDGGYLAKVHMIRRLGE